jgi:hypothetical protein
LPIARVGALLLEIVRAFLKVARAALSRIRPVERGDPVSYGTVSR